MHEADYHVRHLRAGVVNVVLDVNRVARGAQQPHKCIAENGIAQVPDVRRLVGIDAGMLNQNVATDIRAAFASVSGNFNLRSAARQNLRRLVTLQTSVDVARACDFELLEAIRQRQLSDGVFRDLARSFAQALGQFERERQRELAHLHRRRLIDDDVGHLDLVPLAQEGAYRARQFLLLFQIHVIALRSLVSLCLCGNEQNSKRSKNAGLTLNRALPIMKLSAAILRTLMRIAYLDCFSGISGDMFLGALLDAGVPFELFQKTVADLNIGATLELSRVDRAGISATKLDVVVNGEKDMPREEFWAHHPELADSGKHSHTHEWAHSHKRGRLETGEEHAHNDQCARSLSD